MMKINLIQCKEENIQSKNNQWMNCILRVKMNKKLKVKFK